MRGKRAPKREIAADPKYGRLDIAKFTNYLMSDGKKTTARAVMYDCLDIISNKTKRNPVEVFDIAIKNVGPSLEVRGKRVGGANYQIPYPVRAERRFTLACRWIIEAANKKKGKPMSVRLADEIMLASEEQGEAFKKKLDAHKMAEANRAFAHFAR
ncbi:30S ribosomal protein S7 [Candidatus Falkowbacteria bacterium]|nr:30S ribosomal protein S7 [Candidatus Falkowbacteria bacterium]